MRLTSEKWKTTKTQQNDKFEKRLKRYANNVKCLLAVQLSPPLSLLPSISVSLFGLSGLAGLGLLMHFTLYDLFANTLFGQTDREWGERSGDTVGTFNVSGQLTQKACRLISLNIYEIKAQAAGVLKFDSLLWSPAACVRVCVCMGMLRVCVCLLRMRHC